MINNWTWISYRFHKKRRDLYYAVKDFFFPWNVIKLRKLPRHYMEVETLMEYALCQLLERFFDKQQPFNFFEGYVKNPTIEHHRKKLEEHQKKNPEHWNNEHCAVWFRLLNILEWYKDGGLDKDGMDVWSDAVDKGLSHEEAEELFKAFEQIKSDNLKTIIEYRNWLWT